MNNRDLLEIRELLKDPIKSDDKTIVANLLNKEVLIYGAGSYGKEMLCFLEKNGAVVSSFIDKNAEKIVSVGGKKVYTLANYPEHRENIIIIFAIVCSADLRHSIINDILESGFDNVIEAQSLRCQTIHFSQGFDPTNAYDKICNVFEKLADEKSRNIFVGNIKAHLTRDYTHVGEYEDDMNNQYFPCDLQPENGYSCFIDCGGFIGDTVMQVMKRKFPQRVISFEPSIENFKKLADECAKYDDSKTEFTIFNSAVSDCIAEKRFALGTGSGSISDTGDDVVHTVSIDEVLRGIRPTIIKMDIEGEEFNALKGAKNTIIKYTPDLAVCVYHNIDHIWELPYYIYSLNNKYRFYIRSYNSYTMETVLYAYARESDQNEH